MTIFKRSRRLEIGLFSFSTGLQIFYGLLVYSVWKGTFLTHDSVAHLYLGRLLWDRVENMGGVWLPLFHFLVAPFTLIPFLYQTGLAGLIVNSIAAGLTSLLLYRILPNKYGVVAALAFAGNALTLSYSTTAMQQSTEVLLAVGAIYYFRQYLDTDKRSSFFKMAVTLTIGEFARYEMWILALILVAAFALVELKHGRPRNIVYVHLAFWGILLWILWETAIFRDPLFFLHSPGRTALGGALLSETPATAIIQTFARGGTGYLLLVLGLSFGLVIMRRRPRILATGILLIFLLTVPMQLPIFLSGKFSDSSYGYNLVADENSMWQKVANTAHSKILASAPVGGDLLSVLGNVPPSKIIDEYDPNFAQASNQPWNYVDLVVIAKLTPDNAALFQSEQRYWGAYFNYLYYNNPNWRAEFNSNFNLAFQTSSFSLYERNTT